MQLLLLCTAVVYRMDSYFTRKCPNVISRGIFALDPALAARAA